MQQHINTTRRQIGELAAMSGQTEAMERKILAHAQAMLAKVERDIEGASPQAMVSGEAGDEYQNLVMERGRLQQVIAQARAALA